jgi:hypothetical protein
MGSASRLYAQAKQHSQHSQRRRLIKNVLSRVPPAFGRRIKPLVLDSFAVAGTNPHWVRVGYGPFFLCVHHQGKHMPSLVVAEVGTLVG